MTIQVEKDEARAIRETMKSDRGLNKWVALAKAMGYTDEDILAMVKEILADMEEK
jgi:DNA-binding transcriptional regulator YhcF (GntR family)